MQLFKMIPICKGPLQKQQQKKEGCFVQERNESDHLAGGKLQNFNYYVSGTRRKT